MTDSKEFTVLTDEGGPNQISEDIRPFVALLSTGELYVSKSHIDNLHVRSFVSKIKRTGFKGKVYKVSMAEIATLYSNGNKVNSISKSSNDQSDMQKDAMAMFADAAKNKASDIHILVNGVTNQTRIFYRIDGDLEFIKEETDEYGEYLCSAIYQSMTSVSGKAYSSKIRQDARISNKKYLPTSLLGLRVATTPTDKGANGTLMVLRLLYGDESTDFSLNRLGYNQDQEAIIKLLMSIPFGVNIVSGPTGSGKSTTLQCVLGLISKFTKGKKHILTVEDPPEYPVMGANQTPVAPADTSEEQAVEFQKAIKAALRLDPDIVMVGEIRDPVSGKLAIEAGMTGHQVWTTLHANSALAILSRLIDLGIPSDLVYDHNIISGLMAQRLVKKLCPSCKIPFSDPGNKYSEAEKNKVYSAVSSIEHVHVKGSGCDECNHTGFKGRVSVAEVIKTDAHMMSLYRNNRKEDAEEYWKNDQKGKSILDVTIEKITQGIIDPFQAQSIVGPLGMGDIESDRRINNREVKSVAPSEESFNDDNNIDFDDFDFETTENQEAPYQ
jgi:type II secretory ATPase GspE/PulE/Tfp pilus assembly ATPase PilB-like protein